MAEKAPDVKEGDSSTPSAVDEKGVPYLNRVKELERKYQETLEELNALKSATEEPEELETQTPDVELQELVKNPKAYMTRVMQENQLRSEVPQAVSWLESREGYDKNEVLRVIREYGLDSIPSPKKQAEAAWGIVERERLQKKLKDSSSGGNPNLSEPPGRSVPPGPKVKRADLIQKLKEASLLGNDEEQARIIEMLEDVRE